MSVEQRRGRILAALQAHGVISMREVAQMAGTSEATARRDLRLLADQGLVRRTHGGAALSHPLSREPSYLEKARQAAPEKDAIAAAAAELVADGDAIALGAGTTTLALARRMTERSDLTVLTTSLLVCEALLQAPGVQVLVSGGSLRGATHALVGPMAEQSLDGLFVSTLFVSGNGLSAARGLSTPDVLAGAVDRKLAECAARTVVLADHTKIGVEAVTQTLPCDRIYCVITDDRADPEQVRRLEDAGVAVTIAPASRTPRWAAGRGPAQEVEAPTAFDRFPSSA